MTKVINIIAGSGAGKTTTAAGVFYEMKKMGESCELVQEWVKKWAWSGKEIVAEDQITILEKQYETESLLYGKVEYLITDSPFILSPIYEKYYFDNEGTKDAALKYLAEAKENGVEHLFFLLNRTKNFVSEGRYETEEQAKEVDRRVKKFLDTNNIPYYNVNKNEQDHKVYEILYEAGRL